MRRTVVQQAQAAEGHLKWDDKSGGLEAMPPVGYWGKDAAGLGALPPEADDAFRENVLFCHGFKNDSAIFAFIVYTLLNMKWKRNQFGARNVVGQATVLDRREQKVGGRLPPCSIVSAANANKQRTNTLQQSDFPVHHCLHLGFVWPSLCSFCATFLVHGTTAC